jgi:predicted DNA-binding transcriptional regulator AlpA
MSDVSDLSPFEGESLVTARAVATALGMSPRQFRRLIDAGDGPAYFRFGKNLKRYRPSIVRDWAMSRVEITARAIR